MIQASSKDIVSKMVNQIFFQGEVFLIFFPEKTFVLLSSFCKLYLIIPHFPLNDNIFAYNMHSGLRTVPT